MKIALTVLPLVLISDSAFAYIDPGIISSLYQLIYLAVFGLFAGFIVKPFRMLSSLKQKFFPSHKDKSSENDHASRD